MINGIKPVGRSLRWGMVGGGGSSQIGYIHRSAALRDGSFTLLAGAFACRGRTANFPNRSVSAMEKQQI